MSQSGQVLLVEDNELERRALSQLLRSQGFTVRAVESADKALGCIDESFDLVLSDLYLGETSGMELLQHWKRRRPQAQFIMLTGHSSVSTAIDAIKNGAYHYLTKPVNPDELGALMKRAIDAVRNERELENLRQRLDNKFGLERIVGQNRLMKEVFARIGRAAPVDSTVLVLGESGTGKELVAQALHQNSPRKKNAFVAVNCAAVPATLVESELFGHVRGAFTGATDRRIGRFEQADGGTLFIDEIGDFEIGLQAKLLRVLETLTVTPVGGHEDRKVDVRVIAATSRDVNLMIAQGQFREDLFYRLNVVQIHLPPLRDRMDDLSILVGHFLEEISQQKHTPMKRIAPEVMRRFQNYRWPGNVRELRNTLESMIVLSEGEALTEADLPDRILYGSNALDRSLPSGLTMEALEKMAIQKALEEMNGNRTHAAMKLGISVRTLQRKLRLYQAYPLLTPTPSDVA